MAAGAGRLSLDQRYNSWLDAEAALDVCGADEAIRDAVFDALVGHQQRTLDRIGVVGKVNTAVKSAGGQKAFAERAGVSPSLLSMMLNGHRDFSDQVLVAAGVRRMKLEIVRFEPIEHSGASPGIAQSTDEQVAF